MVSDWRNQNEWLKEAMVVNMKSNNSISPGAVAMKPSPPKTKAMLTFEQNLETIRHALDLSKHQYHLVGNELDKTMRLIPSLTKGGPNLKKGLNRIIKSQTKVTRHMDRVAAISHWQVVAMVTCVESYLQEVLSSAAAIDGAFMSKSEQEVKYADVINAASLEDLANSMRWRWARTWVAGGGPEHWIKSLTKMGVSDYPEDLAGRLEIFWGIRHAVVHAAGIATEELIKRHPGMKALVGKRLQVGNRDLSKFFAAVADFLEPTDRYFLKRCPSLLGTPTDPKK